MAAAPRGSKLTKFINHRVKVHVADHRYFIGQLLGLDSHSNMVIKDTEEYRTCKKRRHGEPREIKRNCGLIILRGENVMHVDIIGPPPPSGNRLSSTKASAVLQPGIAVDKIIGKEENLPNAAPPVKTTGLFRPSPGVAASSVIIEKSSQNIIPPSALPQ